MKGEWTYQALQDMRRPVHLSEYPRRRRCLHRVQQTRRGTSKAKIPAIQQRLPGSHRNRINNSTFRPDGGKEFEVKPNDNPAPEAPDGADTLHGGWWT